MRAFAKTIATPCFSALLIAMLAACSTPQAPQKNDVGSKIGDAAVSPFNDFNLVKTEISPVLLNAKKDVYVSPNVAACDVIGKEIAELDSVLGPDLDTTPTEDNPGLIERGRDELDNAATGALKGAAEGVVPFRGWVRRLTGAERHSREISAAVAAGIVRRAYLKGFGQASGCQAPAAPHRASTP